MTHGRWVSLVISIFTVEPSENTGTLKVPISAIADYDVINRAAILFLQLETTEMPHLQKLNAFVP